LNSELAQYLLPEGLLGYFDIVADITTDNQTHFYLEKENILREEYRCEIVRSKVFFS
jgi:hypothetical protein